MKVFSLGIESGVPSILRRLGKKNSIKLIFNALEKIRSIGGIARTAWIVNVPGTTLYEHQLTIEIIRETIRRGAIATWINSLVTIPGTTFYEHPEHYNIRLNVRSFIDFCKFSLVAKQYIFNIKYEPERYFTFIDEKMIT